MRFPSPRPLLVLEAVLLSQHPLLPPNPLASARVDLGARSYVWIGDPLLANVP
jgi:hypothetical protein